MSQPTVFDRNPRLTQPVGRLAWQESFGPMLGELRAQLQDRRPSQIAALSGAAWDESTGVFSIAWLDRTFRITWPDLTAYADEASEPSPASTQGLLLYYLAKADGTPSAGHWIGFRELPDGWLYHQAFQGYTGNRLVQALGNEDMPALATASKALGGTAIDLGDCGFSFPILPRIQLAIVYWLGDDEFTPQAKVLFDAAAGQYLPIDGLAHLGSDLVSRILKEIHLGAHSV
jgi:hypothetical protein